VGIAFISVLEGVGRNYIGQNHNMQVIMHLIQLGIASIFRVVGWILWRDRMDVPSKCTIARTVG
jgi:hypothetical protein